MYLSDDKEKFLEPLPLDSDLLFSSVLKDEKFW